MFWYLGIVQLIADNSVIDIDSNKIVNSDVQSIIHVFQTEVTNIHKIVVYRIIQFTKSWMLHVLSGSIDAIAQLLHAVWKVLTSYIGLELNHE